MSEDLILSLVSLREEIDEMRNKLAEKLRLPQQGFLLYREDVKNIDSLLCTFEGLVEVQIKNTENPE